MRLAFESWGEEGSPLAVLVHGVTASSRTWWRVGPWFAENGWRAVAVDLRGHGKSPRATRSLGLEDLVGDLHETVTALLGPEESVDVLLGHSLGALAALELCREHVGTVQRLVLEEPPGSERSSSTRSPTASRPTLPARGKRRRPTSASSFSRFRRIPRGPKGTLRRTSRTCATATPNRSPRWSATACTIS
jgi:pimeloyl-ACP methyl ester carboxylesterase